MINIGFHILILISVIETISLYTTTSVIQRTCNKWRVQLNVMLINTSIYITQYNKHEIYFEQDPPLIFYSLTESVDERTWKLSFY